MTKLGPTASEIRVSASNTFSLRQCNLMIRARRRLNDIVQYWKVRPHGIAIHKNETMHSHASRNSTLCVSFPCYHAYSLRGHHSGNSLVLQLMDLLSQTLHRIDRILLAEARGLLGHQSHKVKALVQDLRSNMEALAT